MSLIAQFPEADGVSISWVTFRFVREVPCWVIYASVDFNLRPWGSKAIFLGAE